MKLSWKLFFTTTSIFILSLTVFGVWMVEDSFKGNLQRETERCLLENRMLRDSYELTLFSLSEKEKKEVSTEEIVRSFYKREDGSALCIYDENGEPVYREGTEHVPGTILPKLDEENNTGYEFLMWGGRHYLTVTSRMEDGTYLESTGNISEIFTEREEMYGRYRLYLCVLSILAGGVMFAVTHLITKDVKKLSDAVRKFAAGQYQTRADIQSKDEIGALAQDFNWMADAMNLQMEKLEHEVQRQEDFTSAFAHELKTPLTSIIGYADTIRQMELSKEETDMCADYIYRQGKRLQSLAYKLLEMFMAGKGEPVRREISVPEFMKEIEEVMKLPLEEKGVILKTTAEPGVIIGDRELLTSVFLNLIDNARKVSKKGQCIFFSGETDRMGYKITVEDEGGGLPQKELSRITEAFYMVDKSRARREGGAGIGLALCSRILSLHQAQWRIESMEGKGLRITVYFGMDGSTEKKRRKHRRTGR